VLMASSELSVKHDCGGRVLLLDKIERADDPVRAVTRM
jgi:hypothetical protein